MVRAVLRQWLAGESGIEVVGEADPSELATNIPPNAADVFLVEQVGGSRGQCGCVADLLSCQPEACAILLTDIHDADAEMAAVQAGALGVVGKDESPFELAEAVQKVRMGEPKFSPATMTRVLRQVWRGRGRDASRAGKSGQLTCREREVAGLVAEALSNKQIAEKLFISEVTVRHHLTSVFAKLGVSSRLELAQYTYRHGLAGNSIAEAWEAAPAPPSVPPLPPRRLGAPRGYADARSSGTFRPEWRKSPIK
ncbi:MAG: response regulator transcription factor [Candidatus Acidiferrales bacterium]